MCLKHIKPQVDAQNKYNCYYKAGLLVEQSVLRGSYCAPLNNYCTYEAHLDTEHNNFSHETMTHVNI